MRSAPKKLSSITSRTKKNKFQPVVESGGVVPGDDSACLTMDSSDEDQIEDKLVIAEPLRHHSSDKSKKRPFGNSSITGNTNSVKSRKKIGDVLLRYTKRKSFWKVRDTYLWYIIIETAGKSPSGNHSSGAHSTSVLDDISGQQQSVYMKEKNSSKKKAAKKMLKPKEKPEKVKLTNSTF